MTAPQYEGSSFRFTLIVRMANNLTTFQIQITRYVNLSLPRGRRVLRGPNFVVRGTLAPQATCKHGLD